ncbi:MAG: hypothetical protein R2877_00375 [Bdellovibrionota bacterium]
MKRKINLHMFAMIYFLLFFIAMAFNDHSPFMKFPKFDETFGSVMLIDTIISIGIGLLIVMISWGVARVSSSFKNLVQSFKDLLGPLTFSEIFFIAAFSSISEEFFQGIAAGKDRPCVFSDDF